LDRHLNGAPVPAAGAARLLETLARAVHYAHQRGVVHRDLKPANVLMGFAESDSALKKPQAQDATSAQTVNATKSDRYTGIDLQTAVPKIADFGLARLTLGASDRQTHSGSVLGTPSYMAPEQAAGKSNTVGPAADIYALGAILYELLTGRPPFRAATAVETVYQVQFDEPVSPTRLISTTPRDLEVICLKCLHKGPQHRYATALELAEDLERVLHDRPILARPASGVERLWRWCRRRPEVATMLGALVLVILGALGLTTGLWLQAKHHAEEADRQAHLKEEQRLLALESADLAKQRGEQAEQARQRTWQALDEMTSRVINDWLAQQIQISQDQKDFLRKTLTLYEEFAHETGNAPEARSRVANAQLRIAAIRTTLGLKKDALKANQQAEALFEALVTEFPARTEDRQNLAACQQFPALHKPNINNELKCTCFAILFR